MTTTTTTIKTTRRRRRRRNAGGDGEEEKGKKRASTTKSSLVILETNRILLYYAALLCLGLFFVPAAANAKYPVTRFKNETVGIFSPQKDGNAELYVNSHDVEVTGDLYIETLGGKVSEKMKALARGNEEAYEGLRAVAARNGITKVCAAYGTRYQSYDLGTESYGHCTCKDPSHEYGDDVYLDYMGEECNYKAYKLKNQTWRFTTVNPDYQSNINSQYGSGLAVDRENGAYFVVGEAEARSGGSTTSAYGRVRLFPMSKCNETLSGTNENGYVGCQSKTKSGRTCQVWRISSPSFSTTLDSSGYHNYCRNPDGRTAGIWCYTTDPDKEWEECDPLSSSEAEKLSYYTSLGTLDASTNSAIGADTDFGRSVAAYGTLLIVGAPDKSVNGVKCGVVYVYRIYLYPESNYFYSSLESMLSPSDPQEGQRFGVSVSFDGEILLVGSPKGYSGGVQSGAVYAYSYVRQNEWNGYWSEQEGTITSHTAKSGQLFGTSVSLHEGIAIIGSGSTSVSSNNAGAVQSFAIGRSGDEMNSVRWEYRGEILAPFRSTLSSTSFGAALSLNYYSAIICDPTVKKVHLFTRDESGRNWVQESADENGLQSALDVMSHTCGSVTTWGSGNAAIGSPFTFTDQSVGFKDLFPILTFTASSSNVPADANKDAAVALDDAQNNYGKKKK
jgi:hypothetical protein